MITLSVNGEDHRLDLSPDTPLLWVLREHLGLTGTKFGCGQGLCGACTVHVDGEARRSCITTVGSVQGKKIVTIEGLSEAHPVKKAWIAEEVSQCGYCQPGQIMQAAALLAEHPHPSEQEIESAMQGNLCRCATYPRIKKAIQRAAGKQGGKP